ncbi:MAG: class I SAM-dependent methyltransferase [Elusimicrobiota bacterium]|nr:class I SAM-dependent methyltransferase [Elusimicrobiota bacterium]
MSRFLENNEYYARIFSPESYLKDTSFLIKYVEQKRIDKIVKLSPPFAGSSLLDIGCGSGEILSALRKNIAENNISDVKLSGIDASHYMVERAKDNLKNEEINISVARSEKLPFKDNSFDYVICSEVLEHVEYLEATLKEISRVLKKGGRFTLTFPNEDLINFIKKIVFSLNITNLLFPGDYKPASDMTAHWHLRKITVRGLIRELGKYGQLKVKKIFYLPALIPVKYIIHGKK